MKTLLPLTIFVMCGIWCQAQTKHNKAIYDNWFISYISDYNRGNIIVEIKHGLIPNNADCKILAANHLKIDTIKLNIMACYKTSTEFSHHFFTDKATLTLNK